MAISAQNGHFGSNYETSNYLIPKMRRQFVANIARIWCIGNGLVHKKTGMPLKKVLDVFTPTLLLSFSPWISDQTNMKSAKIS